MVPEPWTGMQVHSAAGRAETWSMPSRLKRKRAGVPDVNWHDLRRTAGCRWLQDYGKSMGEVSIMLGHSSIQVTERSYGFFDRQRLAEETAAQRPTRL